MTSRIQIRRTATANTPPANNSLAPGELYVEEADPAKLWVGVAASVSASGVKKLVDETLLAPLASPVFSGDPRAPTPATSDNDTSIATTAYVKAQGYLTTAGAASTYAPLASPVLTGDPQAPTPVTADNDTSIATTAFVKNQNYATTTALSGYLALSGGTMTGPIALAADPASALQPATKQYVDGRIGAPNKLINPFMEIDQANEGATVSTAPVYVIDGMIQTTNIGTVASHRSTDAPPDGCNSIIATQTATGTVGAGSFNFFEHRIEAEELADTGFGTSSAKTISLAFWAKASVAGTYGCALRNTANNRSFVFAFTLSANTWQLVTQIISGDTTGTWVTTGNGTGLFLGYIMAAGTNWQTSTLASWQGVNVFAPNTISNTMPGTLNATFQIGGHGLWVAPAPQPLLRTSFQAELARCQRYYEKSYDPGTAVGTATINGECLIYVQFGGATGNSSAGITVPYKITKRASGTVTAYSPSTGAAGKMRDNVGLVDVNNNFVSGGLQQFTAYGTAASSGVANLGLHWTADARL